jgi:hypothetical protein
MRSAASLLYARGNRLDVGVDVAVTVVLPRTRSAARSATAIVGAFVLPRGTVGMIEASTTRRPSIPRGLFSDLDRRLIVAAQDGSHKIDSAVLNKPHDPGYVEDGLWR